MGRMPFSVGFADLAGFGAATRALGDEAAVTLLDEAFAAAGEAITARGRRIRKYVGDSILFTFIHPQSAAAAAAEIAASFRREVADTVVRFRVSVATGEVVVAIVGHPSWRVEDVFGETVNRAAWLLDEAARSPSGVALDDETRRLAGA